MNCRTHEHRHFERILRACSCSKPTLVSGSVLPSIKPSACIVQSPAVLAGAGLKSRLAMCQTGARQAFDAQGLPASMRLVLCFTVPRVPCRFSCPGGLPVQLLIAGANQTLGPERIIFLFSLSISRPDIKGGYPPNLSILISGGKENNSDSLSNGE